MYTIETADESWASSTSLTATRPPTYTYIGSSDSFSARLRNAIRAPRHALVYTRFRRKNPLNDSEALFARWVISILSTHFRRVAFLKSERWLLSPISMNFTCHRVAEIIPEALIRERIVSYVFCCKVAEVGINPLSPRRLLRAFPI